MTTQRAAYCRNLRKTQSMHPRHFEMRPPHQRRGSVEFRLLVEADVRMNAGAAEAAMFRVIATGAAAAGALAAVSVAAAVVAAVALVDAAAAARVDVAPAAAAS